ncbi:hypothetical protein [Longitalea arenae]|uniref:hypothetical protein n=1 Tax=Longitalea arenae TaxID=2812558 RepID=UPI0019671BE6|nr:hypothetical protein [Longitalea arenae]
MHVAIRYIICYCWCFTGFLSAMYAQDSTKRKRTVGSLAKEVYRNFLVTDNRSQDSTFFQKSEESFRPFTGKVIRRIVIRNLSFGENVNDTAHTIISALTRTADRLQTNTQDWVIRELLFIKKGQLVDPYLLADNERFLRDQNFIKDARIVIRRTSHEDSVDVLVRLRDVFSWGAEVKASGIKDFQLSVYDANFLGMAQRLELTALYDRTRNPVIGPQIRYRKTSLFGSFINVDAAYTTIDKGASLGFENERAYYLKLDRPLYTPNARFAGGLELSWNQSTNVYQKPPVQFSDYKYQLGDAWLGYNIGVYKQRKNSEDSRRRRFVSVRYFDQRFIQPPKLDSFDARYVDKRYVLGQFTWYKINFYRTNYIYGFGRTEDIPVGMMRKITIGPAKVDSLHRLYVGWEFDHWLVDKRNNYWNYTLALGTNLYKKEWQDNSAFLNFSWFSRLFDFPKFKMRQFANISYSAIYNHRVYEPLYINNEFGLDRFSTDSVRATQRISAGTETSLYTRWRLLGFRIGFFTFGRATLMTPAQTGVFRGGFFPAVGGGIRTRNENLIFGTVEARFTWFPRTLYDVNNITLTVHSNLRVRFTGSFVQAPWFALVR